MPEIRPDTRASRRRRTYLAFCVLADLEMRGTVTTADLRDIEARVDADAEARAEIQLREEQQPKQLRPKLTEAERAANTKAARQRQYLKLKADPVKWQEFRAYNRRRAAARRVGAAAKGMAS